MSGPHSAGKGDKYRKVDLEKYRENYEKIFGKKKKKVNNGKRNKDRPTDKS
tara:strand:+ start:1153 stop:1305 length:153 start_codon:yes stop_codon:yes gene_type:complete